VTDALTRPRRLIAAWRQLFRQRADAPCSVTRKAVHLRAGIAPRPAVDANGCRKIFRALRIRLDAGPPGGTDGAGLDVIEPRISIDLLCSPKGWPPTAG